ncbi:MAG: hypothetical protein JO314_13435 [Acidobacteria bacterium]|nr:hypothetical protein [Acidobacteriota bacterium]
MSILRVGMDELDESWAVMLMAASERAAMQGREDVAEYLRLKATNDAIRAAGVKWLLDAFAEIAFKQGNATIKVEREERHSFKHGVSTMAGTRLTIRYGVRCLDIEAGWARTPSHGIMRQGALAQANILHFGRSRENETLKLIHGDDLPRWILSADSVFHLDDVARHVGLLLAD